ncbi:MAG: hypothetical protein IKR48_09865 [Kiritimatiellae bacterium]|nr:hypothetical protein [Kiritimatiellia bacterium]
MKRTLDMTINRSKNGEFYTRCAELLKDGYAYLVSNSDPSGYSGVTE